MMYLLCFTLSGCMGLAAHHYVTHFAQQLTLNIYASYCEIFPENPPPFLPQNAILKPIKCGKKWLSFLTAGTIFALNNLIVSRPIFALMMSAVLILLFVIGLIDWHYKLISPALCQLLLCIGLGAAYYQIISLPLEQSLFSAGIGFGLFWGIFHISTWYYQKEAFGRGDYWLIAALSSFLPWQLLPLFIFLACLSAIGYALISRTNIIPFAPFLSLGAMIAFVIG